jgi:hypothetical protein
MILIVAFILLGLTALYSIKQPCIMVAAAICVFGFEQWAQVKMPFFVHNSTFLNLYVGILTLLGVVTVALRGHNPLDPFPNGAKLVYALYIYAYVSIVWSLNAQQSAVIMGAYGPYIASSVFLAPLLVYRPEHFKKAMLTAVLMGTIIMVLLVTGTKIHNWGRTIVLEHNEKVLDKAGELTDRLSPLSIAEMGGQVALIVMLMNFSGLQRIWSLARWFIVFLGLFLIVRSGSRGQLLAIVAVGITFFGASRSKTKAGQAVRSIVSFVGLAGLAMATMVVLDAFDRWNVESMTEDYQQTRFEMSGILLSYWFQSGPLQWIFGLGGAASWDSSLLGGYCHVQPIEVLSEFGIVGFGLYLAIIYQLFRSWLRVMKIYKADPEKRGMSVALAALFAFSFMLSLKQGSFIGTPMFGLLAILLFRYESLAVKEHSQQQANRAYWHWCQQHSIQAASPPLQTTA